MGISRRRRGAASVQRPDEGPLRQSAVPPIRIIQPRQARRVQIHPPLDRQDSLTGGRQHFLRSEDSGNPLLQSQPPQSGHCQDQGGKLPLVQLAQPGEHIAPHRLHPGIGIKHLKLKGPPQTGAAHRPGQVQGLHTLGQHQGIPGIFPAGKRQKRQVRRLFHGQILAAMYTQLRPAGPERLVQLPDKQALAADLIQRPVQDPIPSGLHGHQFQLQFRVQPGQRLHHLLALNHRQTALPAGHTQFHSHSSSVRRRRLAASAVLRWSPPSPLTPATTPWPIHMAGKKNVHSSRQSATLTGIPSVRASWPI